MNLLTRLFSLCCMISAIHAHLAFAQETQPPQTLDELKTTIEKIRQDTNTPAIAIALVNKDGPYWIAGLGEANREKHIKADENTLFPLDSISKMFVSLSILKLVEEKKLNLKDKLQDLAPEIKYENRWEKTNPVLLVHLLEHTTGWDEVHLAESNFKASDSSSLKEALDFHPDSRTSRWVPGTRYAYNSIGPAVAAYIVEKISGKKYEAYVKETFFNPLGMNTSNFYKTGEYENHGAVSYSASGKAQKHTPSNYRPSGSINSSAKEMANLLHFYIQKGEFSGQQILKNQSLERMEKPTSTLGNTLGIRAGHGLNNFTKGYQDFGYDFHGHDGGSLGSFSEMMYSRDLEEGYIILINTNNGSAWQVSQLIMGYLLKNKPKKSLAEIPLSNKLKSLDGIFIPVNPQIEIKRFSNNIEGAIKISVSANRVHRSPVFGGWQSNDYSIGENLLVNPWSGLPSIALVNDPLLGESLQVEGDLYKRIPESIFFVGVGLIFLLLLTSIANLLFSVIWVTKLLLGKYKDAASIKLNAWLILANTSFLILVTMITAYGGDKLMGTLSWVSITIFVSSILLPVASCICLIVVYKSRRAPVNKLTSVNAMVLTLLLALISVYFTYYGVTGFAGWVL